MMMTRVRRVRMLDGNVNGAGITEHENDVPVFLDARFLNGLESSINTMPMLKICTPPPDI